MNQNGQNATPTPTHIPGVTLEDEKNMLSNILTIADQNLKQARASFENMADELHELKEIYDVEDKEGLALWFNTDARFQQVRQELFRMERSRKKPYFGRIDFTDSNLLKPECYYIGKAAITRKGAELVVIDWRAPIASVYYESSLGLCTYFVKGEEVYEIDLTRKRTYEIEEDELKDFYDSDVVANDDLLTKYLSKNKNAVLKDIIATIQQEQNEIIRKRPQHNVIVQGGAGSGKTTVAMHRISYILYNYELEFKPQDFYIIGSNRILLNYITGILPDLDVYGIAQMTLEQLFIRLLYEDWDHETYGVKKLNREDKAAYIKGSFRWFHDLEAFCRRYEWNSIPREDVYLEPNHRLLMSKSAIEKLLTDFEFLSLPDKLEKLTEHLIAKLENEIYGRYHTYPPEEQKRLQRYYQTYFGKREWRGSIFDFYHRFLKEQNEKGNQVPLPQNTFDLYDLAALAYIYKRIKEVEVIQEASHVVIDEAQDFGMMAYGALKYCLSKCTFTIMGDVSQNIYFDYGLTDWEELRNLMLPGEYDYFGLLKKSYRNTVEISDFAIHILQHGNFPIYPVEPIIRHGNEVLVKCCGDGEAPAGGPAAGEAQPGGPATGEAQSGKPATEESLIVETAHLIIKWQENGYETIAVICRDEEEVAELFEKLKKYVELRDFNAETEEFGGGVMVLPIEYAKGLEFDAVLLFDVSQEKYPVEDGFARLLYVAATRALHELAVLYSGTLTDLIGSPVPEEKKQKYLLVQQEKPAKKERERQPKTNRELEQERVSHGKFELEFRDRIGPGKIIVKNAQNKTSSQKVLIPPKGIEGLTFGSMPASDLLRPAGHTNVNLSVLWVSRNKKYAELASGYGILRITPVSESLVRITFGKELPEETKAVPGPDFRCREGKERVEIAFGRLVLRIDKKTGGISFYTKEGRLLLTESAPLPRQLANVRNLQTWSYFNWEKKEKLKARGISASQFLDLKSTAKCISFDKNSNRPACICSDHGYQILIPPGRPVICCTIPTYGSYLYTEGEKEIDYFFEILPS